MHNTAGLIAQDVESVLPEAIRENDDPDIGFRAARYAN